MSIKLTDTQLVLLSAAAIRDDRCIVLPNNLKGGAAQKVAAKLIATNLVKEIKAKTGAPVWRRDEQTGQSYALRMTASGAKAIVAVDSFRSHEAAEGADAREPVDVIEAPAVRQAALRQAAATVAADLTSGPDAPRSGTKIAQVLALLRRDQGATLDQLVTLTGWLPHTTRAALTGLRKRGFDVAIDRSNAKRGSSYRIGVDPSAATGDSNVRSDNPLPTSVSTSKSPERHSKSQTFRAA